MKEPIRKITWADGTTRYRLVVDIGRDTNGNRKQVTRTYDRLKQTRDELSRIRHEIGTGAYVKPSAETLDSYLDEYLTGATRDRRESTKASYRDSFRCPRELLGHRELQSITKADIEKLVEYMQTFGRKRGGTPCTGLGARSVRLTLGRLSAAFTMAVREGKLARNPVALVTPPQYNSPKRPIWNRSEVATFLRHAAEDRLHAAWRLSLYGLRRGEVLGLRWSDIDLQARTLTITQARVLVDYQIRIEEPKSINGTRTLPLDDALLAALTALRKRQTAESAKARSAYGAGLSNLDWYTAGEAYVVTDELGIPVHPEWYSDEFTRLLTQAGLRRIRLHDSRHTTLSLMEKAGVPISILSKWAGHHDTAFTMRTYVHADDEDLKVGSQALAQIHASTTDNHM